MALAPDGQTLALAGDTVALQRASDGQVLKIYHQDMTGITTIQFSPDSRHLAWGRDDATLVVARNPYATSGQ